MREQHNVPTKNTNDPPISPVVDGQERTTNWVTVMYANIAAHRAVRSWFLRLIVNVVICAPWDCA